MRVNVVVRDVWILSRFVHELAARVPDVTINVHGWPPATSTACDYFLPAHNVRHLPSGAPRGLRIGYFTHGDDRAQAYWGDFDVCLTMNRGQAELLRRLGARDVRTILPGTDPPDRPAVFGICGHIGRKSRKGADLVANAVRCGFTFVACTDVPSEAPCRVTHTIEDRAAFYRSIDYLVVPGTDEGGPMPVLEAIQYRKPVIAPDIGWCWEFPVIRYERGSPRSLRRVLRALDDPPTWDAWGHAHAALFGALERGGAA